MAMEGLDYQLKLMALLIIYIRIGARGNVFIHYQINRCQHAESFIAPHCKINIKSETETYTADLIFMQLPGVTWNDQEFKTILTKINHIIHWHQFLQQIINTSELTLQS